MQPLNWFLRSRSGLITQKQNKYIGANLPAGLLFFGGNLISNTDILCISRKRKVLGPVVLASHRRPFGLCENATYINAPHSGHNTQIHNSSNLQYLEMAPIFPTHHCQTEIRYLYKQEERKFSDILWGGETYGREWMHLGKRVFAGFLFATPVPPPNWGQIFANLPILMY